MQTPYVRLLALAGINVVLAGEFAGEAGPMAHYATARAITGRAGLFPRRHQSDQVDLASGRLARRGNRRLRQALLLAADTLARCNDHFRVLAAKWAARGKDARDVHVRVAGSVRPDRLPDGDGRRGVRASRLPGQFLCNEQIEEISRAFTILMKI